MGLRLAALCPTTVGIVLSPELRATAARYVLPLPSSLPPSSPRSTSHKCWSLLSRIAKHQTHTARSQLYLNNLVPRSSIQTLNFVAYKCSDFLLNHLTFISLRFKRELICRHAHLRQVCALPSTLSPAGLSHRPVPLSEPALTLMFLCRPFASYTLPYNHGFTSVP